MLQGKSRKFYSKHLEQHIVVLPGVFAPGEAVGRVLPFLKEYRDLFAGKRVLEIGTGTGIISLYAAHLGAKQIVATDISSQAVRCAQENARLLGFENVIDVRLVPPADMSAYSVIRDEEMFDVIITNAPYALDLDAKENSAVTDNGDLGFSIIRGFESHLTEGGVGCLYYNSLFYHVAMVKFARHRGYDVRNHVPDVLTPWEATTLFNSYLARFLTSEGIPTDAFKFIYREDFGRISVASEYRPLFPETLLSQPYPGMMVITRP